ncbi:adhesion G-protein coupled receptor G2-like [Echeneis naucrates]|uniref:adhesion G-protein coupled receptor G2-like n=1 Tax=Echeneis naucrates TaxID=173247 RepID=UPI0011137360|nr:adhesion G-protein coupled receptor G2-like [Echeneis naucrates]
MKQRRWVAWIFLASLLCIPPVSGKVLKRKQKKANSEEFWDGGVRILVPDNYNGILTNETIWSGNEMISEGFWPRQADKIIKIGFLQKDGKADNNTDVNWPKWMDNINGSKFLYLRKQRLRRVYVLFGENCSAKLEGKKCDNNPECNCNSKGQCQVRCLKGKFLRQCQEKGYDDNFCTPELEDRVIINVSAPEINCFSCVKSVKKPETVMALDKPAPSKEGKIDPVEAIKVMDQMSNIASNLNGSSVALSAGEGITGILVKETESEPIEEVSFAYSSPDENINIIQNKKTLDDFSRSVTVSKEAFDQARSSKGSGPFAAVFRFLNMAEDEMNSNILENEVMAIEMGSTIKNLTDKIKINFWKMKYTGLPQCHSWNGTGTKPLWTNDGCETVTNGTNITCQCSHLTFFAILLAPLNETISSGDLARLTTITQVGCGLSMFFLSIALFMHFLFRRTKANKSTRILIHIVLAMFWLNFTFLINNFVAKMKSDVSCKIMAAAMHYFMLATFTWFATQAFHLCLQLYNAGKIQIPHYILKVSVTSWAIPSIVVILLLIIGKYGEQIIHTENVEDNVSMCWITDSDVHYIVNIGYYASVFLVTFTTFIVVLFWLYRLRRADLAKTKVQRNGISMATVLGLCCMLGITWGFAFFAYGALRIPSYYIFTVLNSFQGFFLFIYYYRTSKSNTNTATTTDSSKTSSVSTLKTGLDVLENPYSNTGNKK